MPLEDIHVKEFLLLIFTWFSLAKGTVAMEKRITTKLQNINFKALSIATGNGIASPGLELGVKHIAMY